VFSGIVSLAVAKEVGLNQLEAQRIADAHYTRGVSYAVTYDVATRGEVQGDLETFRETVAKIFADDRGWKRAGVTFTEVESGGKLHMILASGPEVKKASPIVCSDQLSCHVNGSVFINDARWMGASSAYKARNVSVEDYRKMVVNHEVGHFLGHDHDLSCGRASGLGPIMIDKAEHLGSCQPTYWPLPNELWVRMK
jgi:hypothetical protein